MNLFSWFVAGSQLFFSCTGTLTNTYMYTDQGQQNTQHPDDQKATASLMLDETKQAFAFKPSNGMAGAAAEKFPYDVANKRHCLEINARAWDRWIKESSAFNER